MDIAKQVVPLLLVVAAAGIAGPAGASTACTPVTSLPAVITTQGVHCFTHDLSTNMTTGNAIEIQANNVTLDLNGFTLGGLSAGSATETVGIFALEQQNITIRNGTVRGFAFGIFLEHLFSSRGHLVELIRADQNTAFGIYVEGAGVVVRQNQVTSTGGSTFDPETDTFGIAVFGAGPRVVDNDVNNTFSQGAGVSRAIWVRDATGGLVVRNRITTAAVGIFYDNSTGKYRGNLTFGVTTPFVGGTDAGDNN